MKSYEEMAREVLEIRDREVARRRIIRKRTEKIVGVSLCACAAFCIIIGVSHSRNLAVPLPDVDIITEVDPQITSPPDDDKTDIIAVTTTTTDRMKEESTTTAVTEEATETTSSAKSSVAATVEQTRKTIATASQATEMTTTVKDTSNVTSSIVTTTTNNVTTTTSSYIFVYTTTTTKGIIVTTTTSPIYTTTTTVSTRKTTTVYVPPNPITTTTTASWFPIYTTTTTMSSGTTTTASVPPEPPTTTTVVPPQPSEPKFYDYCKVGDKVYEFAYYTSMTTYIGEYIGTGELYCEPDYVYRREEVYEFTADSGVETIAVKIENREVYYDGYYIYSHLLQLSIKSGIIEKGDKNAN